MRERLIECWYFFLANLYASYFGAFLLSLFLLTEYISIPNIGRYDVIFIGAVVYQLCALIFRFERLKEFLVIIVFHILATVMELFKTHPAVGSWLYPGLPGTYFALATVPLFTGFLYSAVGSYISRSFHFLHLTYTHFPARIHLCILASLIYVNFFTHHYFYDIRYLLLLYSVIIFYRTQANFQVYKKVRQIPLLVTAFLTAFFVWIAENVGTATRIWLYPNQVSEWHLVTWEKIGSWYLLLILSFALVSIIYRERIR